MTAAKRVKTKTPRSEDYLEVVYHLIHDKGYATTTDISTALNVKPPTVSNMIGKLAAEGYLKHEPYRGMRLTDEGESAALSVIRKHKVISDLLSMIGVSDEVAYEDTEGMEHYLHPATIGRMEKLAEYLRNHPDLLSSIKKYIESG